MRTSQSFGVHFTIKKEKAKDGMTNVYAAVTINKERIRFALKHYVKVENWDRRFKNKSAGSKRNECLS